MSLTMQLVHQKSDIIIYVKLNLAIIYFTTFRWHAIGFSSYLTTSIQVVETMYIKHFGGLGELLYIFNITHQKNIS